MKNTIDLTKIYDILRRSVRKTGRQNEWAKLHGISPQYLCDVLNGRADPGPKILNAIGYQSRTVYYRRTNNDIL